ncbi:HlyD family secretion protein [Ammonifex degensii]|uniref:HlyD family secretion protein n=1 Tax=Ammonifex degensii TaxID=42838 RepID=UPI000302CA54|nr:biotin/lipoyl-binding protein [Ammonifex degensii]
MISRRFGLWTALVLSLLLLASGCRSNNPSAELSGMVEAQEVDVAAKIPGRVVELKVEEGDTVKKGQVIAVIEAKELEDKKRQAEAQLSVAQAQCQKAQDALLLQQKLSDADYQAAQAALDRALAEYNKVSKGTQTQIEQAQAKLEEAKAQLSPAEKTFQRYQQLYSAGAVPQQALDEVKAKYEAARQQVRQAEEGLEFLKGVAQEEDVRAARAAVSQAQAALLKAEAGRMQTLLAQSDLAAAEAKRQQAEAALAEVKHSLEDTIIKAPLRRDSGDQVRPEGRTGGHRRPHRHYTAAFPQLGRL